MLELNESKLLFKSKKRRKSLPLSAIVALFILGIILVVVAVIANHESYDDPELPESLQIAKHASSLPEGEDFAPHETDADDSPKPDQDEPEPKTPKNSKKAPEVQIEDEVVQNPTIATAMYDFANIPVSPGALKPQIGRYTIINTPLKYDENASPEAIAAAQAKVYVVVSGDILGRIAQKHGCTIAQLQKANRMANDQIKIGQKLLIPDCDSKSEDAVEPLVPEQPQEEVPPPVAAAQRGKWWKKSGVNTKALPQLMAEEGFTPPQKFMAFIIELTFDQSRQVVVRERAFDYKGTSSQNSGWNPASAVKLFAAIAALKRIDELGFTSRAKVTFHGKKPYTTTVGELVESAIINSNNISYNRVVQLASFDKLHKEILTSRYGITQTALNRAYEQSTWKSLGEDPSLRISPAITLTEGKKTVKLPAVNSKASAVCTSGACTSLQDLGESSRRLMLQEQLPADESFNLKREDLLVLRRAMRSSDRVRGTEMVDRFAAVFKDSRVKFYSKPGFSEDWFTDNVYIFDPSNNQAWIVVMSGYPGRSSLNSAATAIAKIISSGKLRKIP